MISTKQITVLLADDHPAVRQSLRTLLSEDGRILIIGEARNGREAVDLARKYRPGIILMDISMPVLNGLDATCQILGERPSTKIIILSAHVDEEYMERAREVGAVGFVAKQVFAETLTWVIHEVAMGRRLCDPVVNRRVPRSTSNPFDPAGVARGKRKRLTARESELLQLVGEGSPKKQIAASLSVSIKTLEHHLLALMNKLSLSSFANLADYAIASGCTESNVVLTIT
jgi:DNA-binding NarL/FixJ family response regulator